MKTYMTTSLVYEMGSKGVRVSFSYTFDDRTKLKI